VTICRLDDRRKNVDVILRALALLRQQFKFQYSIVGDGPLRTELEELSHKLGLSDCVQFAGRVSSTELHDRLSTSDLFLLTSGISPTNIEGFGIVYLEANACGVPVLAARCGGAIDAVEEGISGWFVDRIEPESVSAALARFFRGKLFFSPEACRQFAQRFTWGRVCEHITAKYAASMQTDLHTRQADGRSKNNRTSSQPE
jgi:glycosyltransferase involved in cell wall biosynthesis